MRVSVSGGAAVVTAALLTACAVGAGPAEEKSADVALPPASGVFDYQLGGGYDQVDLGDGPVSIDVVVRDSADDPLDAAYNVCYVNGYQTQPDDGEFWLEREELLLHDAGGELVVDPEWDDEYILDPSTSEQRKGILDIIGPVVDGCATAGFDAVEIDNLDTWTRFEDIDEGGAHALARAYAARAHGAGMAIAQKNAAEIAQVAREELGFDFAVAEECGVWEECAAYTDVYGDHVLQIEYPESLEEEGLTFDDVCGLPSRAPMTVLRDRGLVQAGDTGYLYDAC